MSCAQNENSDKNREEKKPSDIRFFPDDKIETKKVKKSDEQKTESFSAFSDTIIKTEKPKNSNMTFSDNLKQKDDDKNNNKMLSREQADLLLSSLVPGKDYKITNGIVTILSSNEQYILPRV